MKNQKPAFNCRSCLSCSMCSQACPFSCISMTLMGKQGKYQNVFPELMCPERCIGCGQCVKACPMNCVVLEEKINEG